MLKKLLIVALLTATVGGSAAPAHAYTWSSGSYSTKYASSPTYRYSSSGSYSGSTNSSGSYQRPTYSTGSTYQKSTSQSVAGLKYGSTGTSVKRVQGYLKALGYNLRTENGRFGYYTLKAVLDFQKKNGLSATGVVDSATEAKLQAAASGQSNPSQPTQPTRPTTPTTPSQPTPPSSGTEVRGLSQDEQQMLNLVNQERTKRGLAPLKVDMELVKLARMKSKDMIDNNYFSHSSPTYGSPFTMMKNAGIAYRTAGENLAGARTATGAHTNLMNSSGHRANILHGKYTHIGIGIVDGGPYGKMFTQMFVGR